MFCRARNPDPGLTVLRGNCGTTYRVGCVGARLWGWGKAQPMIKGGTEEVEERGE